MTRKLSLSLAILGFVSQLAFSGCSAKTEAPAGAAKAAPGPGIKPGKAKGAAVPDSQTGKGTAAATQAAPAPEKKADATPAQAAGKKPRAEVLDPNQFFGMAMVGYAAAKAAPEVMENLFCYCGCDLTDSHNSLLDCFTSIHGVDCHICQDEAQIALKMHKQGAAMLKIQQRIDEEFAKQYPFEEDTPTYTKYKAGRLWVKGAAAKAEPASTGSGPDPKNPKLKPGAKAGNCCGGADKHAGAEKH